MENEIVKVNTEAKLSSLPSLQGGNLRKQIATRLKDASSPLPLLVALDDDPTGTQTCHDIIVLTVWDVPTLTAEFSRTEPGGGFFILTNSRALHTEEARQLIAEICRNLQTAAKQSGVKFEIVLRSDSTLRGHLPAEPEVVDEITGQSDLWILAPFFFQGGRYTIDDVHYVKEGDDLIPAGLTPFAQDATFGYRNSNLRDWVVEKTNGTISKERVKSITIGDVRVGGPKVVAEKLMGFRKGDVVVLNAAAEEDMDAAVLGILDAAAQGKKFLFRTGAAFVSTRLGIESIPPLSAQELGISRANNPHGGLIIVGSYVPKTTSQVQRLIERRGIELHTVILQVRQLLESAIAARESIANAIQEAERHLKNGEDVLVMTSRDLVKGKDERESLQIGSTVSKAVLEFANGLKVRPRYVISKGGITSSNCATDWLNMKRATIVGQAAAGVPVWRCDEEEPDKPDTLVIWPGNVGTEDTLCDVVEAWYQ
jgi:uncharacterized protein YgbK (DUF1537 family)